MVGAVQTLARTSAAPPPAVAPAPSGAVAQIDLSLHGDLGEVASVWRDFESRAEGTAFQSFRWLSAWFGAIGRARGVQPLIVVGRQPDGRVLFLFPLAVGTLGPFRRLTWLGSHLCDYNAPLLAPEFSALVPAAAFAALWQRVQQALRQRVAYDLVHFDKMPERCGSQANPFLQLPVGPHPSNAYATQLAADWDTFYTMKRSSATRRRDRTKRKRMAEYGELSFVTPAAADEIERTLGTLFEQKVESLAAMGATNIFAPPGHREFYLDLATDPDNREFVHVSRLQVGTTIVATNLGLVFHGAYYHVLASHGGGEPARFGPGVAHLHELMKYAIGRGLQIFDFTIGDEPYKREWCDSELKLYDHVHAATIKGWLAVGAILLLRVGKRAVKQSPVLWRAFSRGREMLAALRRAGGRAGS
jgi:CelD/BcsL family acetyltransferase involved in cellulose biosynthesis